MLRLLTFNMLAAVSADDVPIGTLLLSPPCFIVASRSATMARWLSAKHIGYRDPIPFEHADEIGRRIRAGVARAEPLAVHGGDRRFEEGTQGSVTTLNVDRGTTYLLRRLARDDPDALAAYERGEHKSVRQAAIAAGIVKVGEPPRSAYRGTTIGCDPRFRKPVAEHGRP